MKIRFLILLLVAYGCETKTKKSISKNSEIDKSVQKKIETENRKFFVGDFDNDKVNDTAFVNYKWNIETNEIECGKNNCEINIEFKKNIPKISLTQSLGIVVAKTQDVNNDNANEIIVFLEQMKVGGITFPFGLLKMELGMRLQKQMLSYLITLILKIE